MATSWTLYNRAKKKLMDGTVDLDTDVFKVQLHTSASNASTPTLSAAGSLTSEVSNGNGYATGGKSLTSITWTTGASASEYRWDAANVIWTASGGNISNVKYAVIKNSAGQLICWSRLSSSQFDISSGNQMELVLSSNGIFELN